MTTASHRLHHAARLDFAPDAPPHVDLAGAAFHGGHHLWVVGDDAGSIDLLQRIAPGSETPAPDAPQRLRYGDARRQRLADLLDLPGHPDDEADLGGLAGADGWLWLVGSHGHKRKNTKPGRSDADNAKRLAKLAVDGNRRLLARVPVEVDADGRPTLVRQARDGRRAARLKGDSLDNELTRLLAYDPHFGPSMALPGKDNGFDIEGLAVDGHHLLLGLRGPVLRGWSALLEVAIEERGGMLRLAPVDADGRLFRKHFLRLDGLGVRDLHFDGNDLHLLAGPTMALDGDVRVYVWPRARQALAACHEGASFQSGLLERAGLPHGRGCDRAEALARLPAALAMELQAQWLVLYDAPADGRRIGEHGVYGDLLR